MTRGFQSSQDPTRDLLNRGRMALEALKSREEAARFHAAFVDLQIALMEGENGNLDFLRQWLGEHRKLMDEVPDLKLQIASFQDRLDFNDLSLSTCQKQELKASIDLQESTPAIEQITNALNPSTDHPSTHNESIDTRMDKAVSPWSDMITGAKQRAENKPSIKIESDSPDDSTSVKKALEIALVDDVILEKTNVNVSVAILASMEASLKKVPPSKSKKKWAWLSSSVIGSVVTHLIAIVVMSTYMIHLARNPEPKSIVASSVETETISMEAPMEVSPSEDPSVDPSETPMPKMPTFATAEATSGSEIKLPTALAGFVTNESSSATGDAIQQATSSTKSNTGVVEGVQFFGVKAAGNTFCYVVDCSASMKKDDAFAAAKRELLRSLSQLKAKQRFYISFFGSEVERLKLEGRTEVLFPVYATPENLQKALIWIDRVRVQSSGAPPNHALLEAIKMDPDGIFLLFDGDTKVDVAQYLRKVNRSDDLITGGTPLVQIHTIGFYTQEFEAMMKRIAAENRGSYRFIPKPTKPK